MEENQWRNDSVALDAQPAVQTSTIQGNSVKLPKKQIPWKWLAIAIFFIFGLVAGLLILKNFVGSHNAVGVSQEQIKSQEVDLGNLSNTVSPLQVDKTDRVVINGQLQANQSLVLTPTAQPDTTVTGLVYLDKSSGELRYYNGKKFITVADKDALSSLSATSTSAAGVSSLQGQGGALNLLGSGGLTITASGTSITVALPQNLTNTADPTFNSLTLARPLGVAQGGTGTNSLSANSVIVTDASGNVISLNDNTPGGLCLLSNIGPGGRPGFTGCSGAGVAVNAVNGGTGTLTIANASTSVGLDGTITIQDASGTLPGLVNVGAQTLAGTKTFTGNIILQGGGTLSGSSGSGLINVPSETGQLCTTAASTACTTVYAAAQGSNRYINFAPTSVQEDHTCDGVDPCDTSTIYVGKTATSGNILRLQGWCTDSTDVVCSSTGQLKDALVLQGNGDLFFRSLAQSDTALQILGYSGEQILNISTNGPKPAFACTVDFENPQPPGIGGCSNNDVSLYQAYKQDPAESPATTVGLTTTEFHFGSQALEIDNGVRSGSWSGNDNHGAYLPYALTYGQNYTLDFWVKRKNVAGTSMGLSFGYYRGSSPVDITGEIVNCSTSTTVSKKTWKHVSCNFSVATDKSGAQTGATGLFFKIRKNVYPYEENAADGVTWFMDDIYLIKGGAVANQATLEAPLLVAPAGDNAYSLVVGDSSHAVGGTGLLVADSLNRQITIDRVANDSDTTPVTTQPALTVHNDDGAVALFQSSINSNANPTVIIQGAASQSQKLLSFQNSSGAELGAFNSSGQLVLHSSAGSTFSGTLQIATLTGSSKTYTLPSFTNGATGTSGIGGSTVNICLSTGNCNTVGGGSATLQNVYDASAGLNTPEILLNNGGDATGFDIQDSAVSIGANLFNVWASNQVIGTTPTPLFGIGNTGATTLKNSLDSASALQVQNTNGVGVLTVDTSVGQVALGNYHGNVNPVNGALLFNSSTSADTVTLQSGTTSGSYALTLPVTAPGTSQCLKADSTTASQLVFGSCGSGGASQALDNLASVAVNTDLSPGLDNSKNLGDATHAWKTAFVNTITPNTSLTLGDPTQSFTLQGTGASVITSKDSGFVTTVGFTGTGAHPVRYNFDQNAATGTYLVCTTANITSCINGGAPSGNYIQNQNPLTAVQTTANFWIDGVGRAATFDAASGTSLNIGTTLATGINLNQNTTVATGKTLTVTSGATSLTASSGTVLTVNNTSTANILALQASGQNVASVSSTGAVTLNANSSTAAFQIQNSAGTDNLFTVNNSGDPTNLLAPVSNFENNVAGWAYSGTPGSIAYDNTITPPYGTGAMKVITTANNGNGVKVNFTLSPSTTYTISFSDKLSSSTFTTLAVAYAPTIATQAVNSETNVCSGLLQYHGAADTTLSTSVWKRHTCTFTTPASSPTGTPYIVIRQGSATAHTFWIDAVQLVQASTDHPYYDGLISTNANVGIGAAASTSTALFVQQIDPGNGSGGGLIVRGGGSGVFSSTTFAIQSADGTNKISYLEGLDQSFFTGGTIVGTAAVNISPAISTSSALVIKGVASQSADLLQAQNSSGTVLLGIRADGSIGSPDTSGFTAGTTLRSGNSSASFSGILNLQSGSSVDNTSGAVQLFSGVDITGVNSKSSGSLFISSGATLGNVSGSAQSGLSTGDTNIGSGGIGYANTGGSGKTGDINLLTGSTAGIAFAGNTISGNINLDVGMQSGTGTVGSINIGTGAQTKSAAASAITVGNSAMSGALTLQGGAGASAISIQSAASGTINLGTANAANTIQIGNTTNSIAQTINIGNNATGSSTDTITIGNLQTTSSTTIQGGTGASAISIQAGTGGTINVGTVNNLSVVIGKSGGTGTLTVNGNSTFYGTLSVNGHIISGNAPGGSSTSFTVGAAACTGGANTGSTGNDTAGKIVIVAGGSGCSSGTLMTVGFNANYASAPAVVVTPGDSGTAAASLQYYVTPGTSNFAISTANTTTASATYTFYYHVVQ